MRFAPEVQSLRAKSFAIPRFEERTAPGSPTRGLQDVQIENLAGELFWTTKSALSTFTLQDRSGPWWSMTLEPKDASTAKISVNGKSADLPAGPEQEFSFHLILDASVAELICNAKHAFTTRIYRKPYGPLRIAVDDSDLTRFGSLEGWQLRAISRDRLTS
jgi:hypothetical protein